MIFNIEAAVVLGIIAAMFYGFCALFPSLTGVIPPFVLAALTFSIGAFAEFKLGLQPRIGIVIPIWCLGLAVFFLNVMIFFGPLPFYGLLAISVSIFAARRIHMEKDRWLRAQDTLDAYSKNKDEDGVTRLGTLAEALFCNRWTRTNASYVQHNLAILEFLLKDVADQFTDAELRSIEYASIEAKADYRTSLIKKISMFLAGKAERQGIGRLR